MRIDSIKFNHHNVVYPYFKGVDNEDEYVYVPLVWNEEPDSFSKSYTTEQPKKKNGIFTKVLGGFGTVTVLPAAAEQVGNGIKNVSGKIHEVTSSVKEDITGTVQDLQEIKQGIRDAKDKFKKTSDENPQETQDDLTTEDLDKNKISENQIEETDDNDIPEELDNSDDDDFDDSSFDSDFDA